MTAPCAFAIALSISEAGQADRIIGIARTTDDVPVLLRAIADRWEQHGGPPPLPADPAGYDGRAGWRPDFS